MMYWITRRNQTWNQYTKKCRTDRQTKNKISAKFVNRDRKKYITHTSGIYTAIHPVHESPKTVETRRCSNGRRTHAAPPPICSQRPRIQTQRRGGRKVSGSGARGGATSSAKSRPLGTEGRSVEREENGSLF